MLFKRAGSSNWYLEFEVAGRRYRESTGTPDRQPATRIERKRHREIEENVNGIRRRKQPLLYHR